MAKGDSLFERGNTLIEIPNLLCGGGTMLYIGACPGEMDGLDVFREAGYDITVLEIFPKNVDYLAGQGWWVVCGNAQEAKKVLGDCVYDVVVWWHGPEHITKEELPDAIDGLWSLAKRLLIVGCPEGKSPKGPESGNPYQAHKSSLVEADLRDLGFSNVIRVKRKTGIPHLTAWREKDNEVCNET